jgi:ABC-2 type transport system permease protein
VLGVSELTLNGIWSLPRLIVSGEIDRLLISPANSLAFLLVSRPEAHGLGNVVTGTLLLGVSCWQLPQQPLLLACAPLWVASGVVIYTSGLVLLGCLCFRIVGPWGNHFWFVYQLLGACRYPLSIYPRWLQWLLLFVFPIGVSTFLPGCWLVRGGHPALALLLPPAVASVAAGVCVFFWHRSTRWYQSTGN